MKCLHAAACAFVVLSLSIGSGIDHSSVFAQSHSIALTFDDLPYLEVQAADYVSHATRATDKLLHTLQIHHAPAVALVTEKRLNVQGERDARVSILRKWSDARVVLGNHTYSHQDFNALSV